MNISKIINLIVSAVPGVLKIINLITRKKPYDASDIGHSAKNELEELEDWKGQSKKDWDRVRGI